MYQFRQNIKIKTIVIQFCLERRHWTRVASNITDSKFINLNNCQNILKLTFLSISDFDVELPPFCSNVNVLVGLIFDEFRTLLNLIVEIKNAVSEHKNTHRQ